VVWRAFRLGLRPELLVRICAVALGRVLGALLVDGRDEVEEAFVGLRFDFEGEERRTEDVDVLREEIVGERGVSSQNLALYQEIYQ